MPANPNPTINRGPVDRRPGTIETTDNQIRIGAQQGRPPDLTRQGTPTEPAHAEMEAGAEDDTFMVFQGGGLQYPLDNAPVWSYIANNGLKSPRVEAVEEFRKALEESEKARHRSSNNRTRKKSVRRNNRGYTVHYA
jgi:Flp pilus assembly protein TadD